MSSWIDEIYQEDYKADEYHTEQKVGDWLTENPGLSFPVYYTIPYHGFGDGKQTFGLKKMWLEDSHLPAGLEWMLDKKALIMWNEVFACLTFLWREE